MAGTLGSLVVEVGADVARLRKDMGKVNKTVDSAMNKVRKSAKVAFGAIAGIAAGIGLKRLVDSSLAVADAFAKQADAIGFTTDEYQKLVFAADKAGVSQSQLKSNLTAFVKRVGEARQGTGPLVTFLKKYDEQLLESIKSTKNQSEALKLITQAMGEAEAATDKAALANAAFSRAGVDMVRLLGDGGKYLDEWKRKAEALGIVIEEDMLRNAENAKDQLSIMSQVIKTKVIQAVVQLAPAISRLGDAFAEALPRIVDFFEGVFGTRQVSQIEAIQHQIASTEAEINRLVSEGAQQNYTLISALKRRKEELELALKLEKAIAEERRLDRKFPSAPPSLPSATTTTSGEGESALPDIESATKSAEKAMSSLEREAKLLKESLKQPWEVAFDSLEKYDEMLEKNYITMQEWSEATNRALDSVNDDGMDEMRRKAGEVTDAMEGMFENLGDRIESSLLDALTQSRLSLESFRDFAKSVMEDITRRLLNKSVVQPLMGQLDSVFSSAGGFFKDLFRAQGGPVSASRPYIVGEKGPEMFVPKSAGNIIPNDQLGGGGVSVINVMDERELRRVVAQEMSRNRKVVVNHLAAENRDRRL